MMTLQEDAVFLSLNDFLSRMLPFRPFMGGEEASGLRGGLPGIATVIRNARLECPGKVVALVAGIDLAGPWYDMLHGKVEMKALEKAGFDLGVPGIHEFESTPEDVESAYGASSLPILAANLTPISHKLFPSVRDHLIVSTSDLKIGIFGLAIPGPGMRLKRGDIFREKNDLVGSAREQVRILQEAGCRIIVAATHIGTTADCRIAAEVSGIHAIFGAHSHTPTSMPLVVSSGDGWKTLVTQAGTAGASLGRMRLFLRNGRVDLDHTTWDLVQIDETIPPDPILRDELLEAQKNVHTRLTHQVGVLDTCLDGTTENLFNGQSSLGRLVADAFRHQSGAQLALISASHIQGDLRLKPGPIDWQTVYHVLPFGNAVCVFELTGQQVIDALALSDTAGNAAAHRTEPTAFWNGSVLYTSGLQRPAHIQDHPEKILVATRDEPTFIEPLAIYQVAGTAFYIHGGDGYTMFKNAKFWNIGQNDAQCLGGYLAQQHSRKE